MTVNRKTESIGNRFGGSNGSGGSGSGSGNSGGGFSNQPPSAARPFNYERHPSYPWNSPSGYTPLGGEVNKAPWGRNYTDHAIERTMPRGFTTEGRSIPPNIVEKTIGYGVESTNKNRKNFTLGDVTVGTSSDGTVHHVNYSHKKKQ